MSRWAQNDPKRPFHGYAIADVVAELDLLVGLAGTSEAATARFDAEAPGLVAGLAGDLDDVEEAVADEREKLVDRCAEVVEDWASDFRADGGEAFGLDVVIALRDLAALFLMVRLWRDAVLWEVRREAARAAEKQKRSRPRPRRRVSSGA